MKYFCPMCLSRFEWDVDSDKYTTRHNHDKIAFAIDPNSELLLDWISGLHLPTTAQDDTRLHIAEGILKKAEMELEAHLKDGRRLRDQLKQAETDDTRQNIQAQMAEHAQREKDLNEDRQKKIDAVTTIKKSISNAQPKSIELLYTLVDRSGLGKGKSGLLVGIPMPFQDGYKITVTEEDAVDALQYAYEVARNDSGKSKMSKEDLTAAKAILDSLTPRRGATIKEVTIPNAQAKCENTPKGSVWRRAGRHQKVCGICRHPLYAHAGLHPEIVIGLLGSERVGKSTVIAATIHAGQRSSGMWKNKKDNWNFDFPITGDDSQWDGVERDLLQPYEKGRAVIKTLIGKASHEFCVSLEMNVPEYPGKVTVTFVDLPGEYLNANIDMLRTHCKGLFDNADLYWLCLDIVQLQSNNNIEFMNRHGYNISLEHPDGRVKTPEELERECDEHIIHPDRFGGLRAIQNELNNFKGRAAILLTKSDEFSSAPVLFNPSTSTANADALIYDTSAVDDGLGLRENKFIAQSRKVLETAYEDYPAWPENLEEIFGDRAFFSVSAYGFSPLPKDSLQTKLPINPYHTRWPMIWTLAVLGYLPVKIVVRRKVHGHDVDEIHRVKARINGNKLEREAYESLCGTNGWQTKRHTEETQRGKNRR